MRASRRVYVVDDDTPARTSLVFLLNTAGFLARPSSSGVAFLDDVASLAPGCVLLDMQMPTLDGLQVIEALGPRTQKFPVIFMTGHGDIATAVRAMKLGACDFLEKPCTSELLLETLARGFVLLEAGLSVHDKHVAALALMKKLTPRETAVLTGLASGLPNKMVAFRLDLSIRTVEMYRASMMDRLGVKTLPEAMRLAFVAGLLGPDDAARSDIVN